MNIGGFLKLSLIDYPGLVAAEVFTQGCNFRCPFCHNRHLVLPEYYEQPLCVEDILRFLSERRDKLQGLVISGGEPTLQQGLLPFMEQVKRLGYAVKLDTNGSRPEVLRQAIERGLVDFFAMDVKGPPALYNRAAGVPVDMNKILESIRVIIDSGIDHIFRTTVVKPYLNLEDLRLAAEMVREGRKYLLQEFIPVETVLDSGLMDRGHYTSEEFGLLQKELQREAVTA